MLILSRKTEESLLLSWMDADTDVSPARLKVVNVTQGRVQLGFENFTNIKIRREELSEDHEQQKPVGIHWIFIDEKREWHGYVEQLPLWHIAITHRGGFSVTESVPSRLGRCGQTLFASLNAAKNHCESIEAQFSGGDAA